MMYVRRRECADKAIQLLTNLAEADPKAQSDISAVHYSRAQFEDRASDYLAARTAAERAVRADPRSPLAIFNLALAQEATGMLKQAEVSWKTAAALNEGEWAEEARRHWIRLDSQVDPVRQWNFNQGQLPAALRRGERATVVRLIDRYAASAMIYFEAIVLPQWAEDPSPEHLRQAKLLASVLSERLKDPFVLEVVEAIERAGPRQREQLRRGHLLGRKGGAASPAETIQLLQAGGSPYWIRVQADITENLPSLERLEKLAQERRYDYLTVYLLKRRAYAQQWTAPFEAMDLYAEAAKRSEDLNDYEGAPSARSRYVDLLQDVGATEVAYGQALDVARSMSGVARKRDRHVAWNTLKEIAIDLGDVPAARAYLEAAITEYDLPHEPDKKEYAAAIRERARLDGMLGNFTSAEAALVESKDIFDHVELEDTNRRDVTRKHEEVRAQLALARGRPAEAIPHFKEALDNIEEDEPSVRASLLAQRAAAHAATRNLKEALQDLGDAATAWRAAEAVTLANRKPGEHEESWTLYFSRSQDTYRQLAALLFAARQPREAFLYDQQRRSAEILDSLLAASQTPERFRDIATMDVTIPELQQRIPDDTFILQYLVLSERTLVWLVSRTQFEALDPLPVRASDIETWAMHTQTPETRKDVLAAAYDALKIGRAHV